MIQLFPYVEVDGIRTLTDSYLIDIFNKMVEDGSFKTVFYNGCCLDAQQFIDIFKHGENRLYIIERDRAPVGVCWLNNFKDTTAYVHFTGFKEVWGKDSIEIGKNILQQLLNMEVNNAPIFSTLLGLIPVKNRIARRFSKAIGMKSLGILPSVCFNYWDKKIYDGEMLYITRET